MCSMSVSHHKHSGMMVESCFNDMLHKVDSDLLKKLSFSQILFFLTFYQINIYHIQVITVGYIFLGD